MASLEVENEDTELLTQPKQADYINFNSRRLRLTILTVLYYIWTIPTISIDINALKNGSLSKNDDKVVYRLVIAGNAFLLIGSIINGLYLIFHNFHINIKYLRLIRYICGAFYAFGAVLHMFAATKKWNVQCVDDYGDSWCRSAYYSVDFFAEIFSLIMAYDIIYIEHDNYLNIRRTRVMIYSFVLFFTSFMFAIVYGYYIKPLKDADRDNLSGYWIVAIATFIIYCWMLARHFLYRDDVAIGQSINNLNVDDNNIELSKRKCLVLGLSFVLITGTALCWIKPSVIITVGTQQPLYRKQFLMFISVAMIIAYDLQLV